MTSIADVTDRSIAELLSLAGRSAVVTGGAQGLGKGIARRLAEAGADVLIGDRNAELLFRRRRVSTPSPRQDTATPMDVSDSVRFAAAAEEARSEFGRLDIWVNNAGVFPSVPITEMSDGQWEQVFAVNTRGNFVGSREAVRIMQAQGRGGVIVNIASLAGLNGIAPGLAAYVSPSTRWLALPAKWRWNARRSASACSAVAPSFMVTEGNLAMMQQAPQLAEQSAEHIPSMFSSKLGRVGVPDDIARAVLFCASDMSIFMTGATLVVDAGETA